MVMYDMVLDDGSKITIIAENIRDAIALAEMYGGTVFECHFVKRFDRLRVDRRLVDLE